MTFLTTLRDTRSSRQIALIDLPCMKNARRIFAIVSTTSIPTSASKNHGSQCGPSVPGSRLNADHPNSGVLFARRFTAKKDRCGNRAGLERPQGQRRRPSLNDDAKQQGTWVDSH